VSMAKSMKVSKIILSCLYLSLIFASIATELSIRLSTKQAMTYVQQIDTNHKGISDLLVEPDLYTEKAQSDIRLIQGNHSIYQYPGYWRFWLTLFIKTFTTAFVVSVVQSLIMLRKIRHQSD